MKVRRRGGLIRLRLDPIEVRLLGRLFDDLVELVSAEAPDGPDVADDPVRRRLFPAGYRDDDAAELEFRSLTELTLRTERAERTRQCAAELAGDPTELELTDEAGQRWIQVLNDLRLALGTQLDITEEDEPEIDHDDPPEQASVPSTTGSPPRRTRSSAPDAVTGNLDLVLTIDRATRDAIVAHARRDHPDEACGVVAGAEGSDRPARFVPDAERRPLADVLRVRLGRPAPALQGDGSQRRGAGRHLPLAHRHRGLPVAHRHLLRLRSRTRITCSCRPAKPTPTSSARSASSTASSPRSPSRWSRQMSDQRRQREQRDDERSREPVTLPGGTITLAIRVRAYTRSTPDRSNDPMAIEVKIPTILRTYTGGAKSVDGDGDTLSALIDNLDGSHPGLKGRLITDDGGLHRFVNVYVNDEDVRFTGLARHRAEGRRRGDDPAGGCRGLSGRDPLRLADRRDGGHPARRSAAPVAALGGREPGAAVGQARGPQPDRFDQGPGRAGDGARGRGGRPADAGLHDPRADVGQHRHLAGDGRQAARLRPGVRDAGEHLDRAAPAAGDVRRADHLLARGRRLEPGRRHRQAARRAVPGLGDALPVRQPGQRAGALRGHRPGDPARPADDHALRRRAWAPPAR